MTIRSTAGVEFLGSVMRYSEIERIGASYRLLRLGNCDFEFDAGSRLYDGGESGHVDTIRDALSDVFSGVASCAFRVVLPSSVTTSYQTVLPHSAAEKDRRRQLAFETRLMTGGAAGGEIFTTESVSSDADVWPDDMDGVYVTHLQDGVARALRTVTSIFGDQPVELVPRYSAVAQVAWAYDRKKELDGAPTVLLGVYAHATEVLILADHKIVRFAAYEGHTAPDRLYFALRTLDTAGLATADVAAVRLYGDRIDSGLMDLMARSFGTRAGLFNPGPIVDLDESRVDDGFAIEGFVPCLGAALQSV